MLALLADVGADERAKLVGEGVVGAPRSLGGENALKPLLRETPARLVVLWTVLIVGVALLVAMALALLKRVRGPESASLRRYGLRSTCRATLGAPDQYAPPEPGRSMRFPRNSTSSL